MKNQPQNTIGLVALWGLLLAASVSPTAHADLVHLTNGRILRGEVVSEGEDYIVLKVPFGQLKVNRKQIDFVESQTKEAYRLDVGREFLQQKRYIRALEQLEQALSENKPSKNAQEALANAYEEYAEHLYSVRRLSESSKYYQRLLKLKPDSAQGQQGQITVSNANEQLDGMIRKAQDALANRDIEGAIAHYQRILAFSADARDQVGGDLGRCHAYRGEGLFRARKFDQATTELEKGFEYAPELAQRFEGLYVATACSMVLQKSNAGQVSEARQDMVRVLTFAPTNSTALYIAGRLEQALKNEEGAGEYFAKGLNTRLGFLSEQRVAKLRADLEASLEIPDGGEKIRFSIEPMDIALYAKAQEGGFEAYETEHFKIRHYNEALAKEVGKVLEAHRTRIAQATKLQKDWTSKATVFLHRTQEEYSKATAQPAWTGGVSRFQHQSGEGLSKMEIHTWQTSPRLFKSVLPHEVAHLVINTHLDQFQALPRAVHEGLAVFMEPDFRHSYFKNFLSQRAKNDQFIPLEELLVMQDYPQDQEFFYAEGFALVQYLVETHGQESVIRLIREAPGTGKNMEAKLLHITGLRSMEELEKRWKTWIMGSK